MKPGDEKDDRHEYEEDHPNPDLRGKTARFAVEAKELHESLPEVDDEFAKDCGDFETLLELRLKIREGFEAAAKQRGDAALKEQLLDSLIEHNDIPVPPSMVQQQPDPAKSPRSSRFSRAMFGCSSVMLSTPFGLMGIQGPLLLMCDHAQSSRHGRAPSPGSAFATPECPRHR